MKHALTPLLVTALLGLCGCSAVLDPSVVQCETADDCIAIAGEDATCEDFWCVVPEVETDPAWVCLGTIEYPEVRPVVTHFYRAQITDILTGRAPDPATEVKLCSFYDNCASPILDEVELDADGYLEVELPDGFQGYFEVAHPDGIYLPWLFQVRGPVYADDLEPGAPLPLTVPEAQEVLFGTPEKVGLAGVPIQEGRTTVFVRARNCLGENQGRISIEIENGDGNEAVVYLEDTLPVPSREFTDPSALAAVVNVKPGLISVVGRRYDDGQFIFRYNIVAREGFFTASFGDPTPE